MHSSFNFSIFQFSWVLLGVQKQASIGVRKAECCCNLAVKLSTSNKLLLVVNSREHCWCHKGHKLLSMSQNPYQGANEWSQLMEPLEPLEPLEPMKPTGPMEMMDALWSHAHRNPVVKQHSKRSQN